MSDEISNAQEPHTERDERVSARDAATGAAQFVGETVKDVALDYLWTGLLWGGIILAWVLPVAGVAVGALFLVLSIRAGRSLFLPITVIVVSVVAWVLLQSPLGLLTLVLAIIG